MSAYYFQTKGLTVGYDGKPLVRDIEIGLRKGEILTLIGPNGCGKTTILKSIAKYLKSIYGAVYIGGESIDELSNKELSRKAAVVLPQKPRAEMMTCHDVVATGRYPYTGMLGILSAKDRAQVQSAMEQVGAWELRGWEFNRVSDGQRQRVLLARALCQQSQIIVLDEPTSFLDIRYKLELLFLLRRMAKERGVAVILSLHELDMAQKASDFVMCVKGEYIARYGAPEEIFKKECIHELFDLKSGSYNPFFGSLELERSRGAPQVFVIAGGGTGIAQYRRLQKEGIPFATGILHENDVDYQVACDLASVIISERSFEKISENTFQKALECIKGCHTVVNCLNGYGEMNMENRRLWETAGSRPRVKGG
ncbi:MAG: ABC transporter ATP-binding protein [Clostridiales bacterium]|jgi:iron complex transport system ATP-binding protein|nr:ABC transporter ATP-binding protein [Clostridiales bacterium]